MTVAAQAHQAPKEKKAACLYRVHLVERETSDRPVRREVVDVTVCYLVS